MLQNGKFFHRSHFLPRSPFDSSTYHCFLRNVYKQGRGSMRNLCVENLISELFSSFFLYHMYKRPYSSLSFCLPVVHCVFPVTDQISNRSTFILIVVYTFRSSDIGLFSNNIYSASRPSVPYGLGYPDNLVTAYFPAIFISVFRHSS